MNLSTRFLAAGGKRSQLTRLHRENRLTGHSHSPSPPPRPLLPTNTSNNGRAPRLPLRPSQPLPPPNHSTSPSQRQRPPPRRPTIGTRDLRLRQRRHQYACPPPHRFTHDRALCFRRIPIEGSLELTITSSHIAAESITCSIGRKCVELTSYNVFGCCLSASFPNNCGTGQTSCVAYENIGACTGSCANNPAVVQW